MSSTSYERAEFVVFFSCRLSDTPNWSQGPLPLENLPGTPYEIKANQAGRRRYVPGEQVPLILWGTAGDPRRWHQNLDRDLSFRTARGTEVRAQISGVELLKLHDEDGLNAIAVIHGRCVSEADSLLSALVEFCNVDRVHGQQMRDAVGSLISPASLGTSVRRGRMMSLVQPGSNGLAEIAPNLDGKWSREQQWLWFLATCHLPDTITVGAAQIARLKSDRLSISDDWAAFSAVEGTAYVARKPHVVDAHVLDLLRQRAFRFHTIETDAFFLSEAQDSLITHITSQIFNARRRDAENPLQEMRSALSAFRLMYWGDRIAERGFTNELLASRRSVKEIPRRLQELKDDVDQVEAEVAEGSAVATNSALGILAVIGLPLSSALVIWQTFEPKPEGLWFVGLATLVSAVVLVWAFPGLRSLPRQFFRRRRR